MESFLYVLHIVLSFVIVIVILLQSGKGGGLGAGFSNAAAVGQEVFGGRGAASFLGKLTWVLGFTFMATSMGLAWYSSQPQSALDLDMQADESVEQVVHTVIDEGGAQPDLPDDFMQQMEGMEGLQEFEGGEAPLDVEFDPDEADLSEEMQQQLQEQLEEMQQEMGVDPDEAPTAPIEIDVDEGGDADEVDVEEPVEDVVEVDEEAQPSEEPEATEEDAAAEESEATEEDAAAEEPEATEEDAEEAGEE